MKLLLILSILGTPALAIEDISADIHRIWATRAAAYEARFEQRISSGDVYALYDTEGEMKNLLKYAGRTHDAAILDDMARLFSEAYPHLTLGQDGYRRWLFIDQDNPKAASDEVQLCSIQFLYAVSGLINSIVREEAAKRTPRMRLFCVQFVPVVVHDHYSRWREAYVSSMKRKMDMTSRVKYQNAVGDKEMLLLAGMAQILAAHAEDAQAVPLEPKEEKDLLDFVALGTALLESRLTKSKLKDFEGRPVVGLNFDLGMWDEFSEYAYSGYTGEKFPQMSDRKPGENVGWDISHGRRFVDVFDALYDNRGVTGQSFPDDAVMRGLANQLAYGVFNGDIDRPLFRNFMDGANGWYRVGYMGRPDAGSRPYGLTSAGPTGGYGFWAKFNPDIRSIMMAFRRWAQRAAADHDPVFMKYYGDVFFPDSDSWQLLAFLPTIAP